VEAFAPSLVAPALTLLATLSTGFPVVIAIAFLLRESHQLQIIITRDPPLRLHSSPIYSEHSATAILPPFTLPDAILRAVSVAYRPLAPTCEMRQLCHCCKNELCISIEEREREREREGKKIDKNEQSAYGSPIDTPWQPIG